MKRRFAWWVLLLGMLGLAACSSPELACDDPLGCVVVEPDAPLMLGSMLDVTGPAAGLSGEVRQGMALALAQRENRLLEHEVLLMTFDAECSESGGAAAAQQIVAEEGVAAVLGPVCAESAIGALPLLSESGVTLVSPANTNPSVANTAVSTPSFYFRTIPHYLHQADVMAQFAAAALEANTAVVMFNDSAYSEGLRETFGNAFLETGGTVPFQTRFDAGSGLEVMLQVAALNEPDVIYLPLYEAEAAMVLNQAASIEGLEDVNFLGPDSLLMPSFMQGVGTAVSGIYVTGYDISGNAYDTFLANWQQTYGPPPIEPYGAFAYDALGLLLTAIENSAQRGSSGALLIGRQALRQAVANTNAYSGLTGSLTCDRSGECTAENLVAVFRLTDVDQLDAPWPPPVVWPTADSE